MSSYLNRLISWMNLHPIYSAFFLCLAILSYGNLFYFGFRLGIPIALRPFLDGHFLTGLTLEFVICFALSAVTARFVVLLCRYILSNFPAKISGGLPKIEVIFEGFFATVKFGDLLDRHARVQLKLVGRWVRRKNLVVTLIVGMGIFSFALLGWHTLWYIPVCIIVAPFLWALVSEVELRRRFATLKNIEKLSENRVYRAMATFLVIYLGFCVFFAGIAHFQHRLDTSVSVGIEMSEKHSSLLAVTTSGILVGERVDVVKSPFGFLSISAHFLPYESIKSIGQKH